MSSVILCKEERDTYIQWHWRAVLITLNCILWRLASTVHLLFYSISFCSSPDPLSHKEKEESYDISTPSIQWTCYDRHFFNDGLHMITPTIPIFTGSYIDYYDIHEIRHMYDTFHQQRYSDRRVSKVTVTLTKARLNLRLTGCLTGCFAFSLSSDRARGGLTPAILQLTSPPTHSGNGFSSRTEHCYTHSSAV